MLRCACWQIWLYFSLKASPKYCIPEGVALEKALPKAWPPIWRPSRRPAFSKASLPCPTKSTNHRPWIWLKQTNKQASKQARWYEFWLVVSTRTTYGCCKNLNFYPGAPQKEHTKKLPPGTLARSKLCWQFEPLQPSALCPGLFLQHQTLTSISWGWL